MASMAYIMSFLSKNKPTTHDSKLNHKLIDGKSAFCGQWMLDDLKLSPEDRKYNTLPFELKSWSNLHEYVNPTGLLLIGEELDDLRELKKLYEMFIKYRPILDDWRFYFFQ